MGVQPDLILEIEKLIYQRCRELLQQQQLIRGLTFYHWCPEMTAT